MSEPRLYDVAVIGAGSAGQMAMLRAVLNHLDTLVFLGDADSTRKSRAAWVAEVENVPGMFDKKRPITTMTREVIRFLEASDDLKRFLTTVKKAALSIRKTADYFEISTVNEEAGTDLSPSPTGERYRARFVVLCTGTADVQPVIGGSIEPIFPYANRGDVLYCVRCDGHKTAGAPCAVIGHQATAGWIAVLLKERYDLPEIHVLTHGKPFEGDRILRELLERYGIAVHIEEIVEILGNPKKALEGFRVGDHEVKVPRAFVSLGSIVYNELAKQLGVELSAEDHVVTNARGETSVPGFYAAGDLVEGKKKQVYTSWDLAVDAVDSIDTKIRKHKREGRYH
jgi:thioredoxin reductase (NADPH)